MFFTELWLTVLTTDSHINMDGFHLLRADRTKENGKKREEGLTVFVIDRRFKKKIHTYTYIYIAIKVDNQVEKKY